MGPVSLGGNGEEKEACKVPLVAQMVRNPPAMQETWVLSLGQGDPLEKETATPSCILAWKILWTDRLQSVGSQELDMT